MAFANPLENVIHLGPIDGAYVADLGAGSGIYSLLTLERVGENGKVISIDINELALKSIKNSSLIKGYHNLDTIVADINITTHVADEYMDIVILSNVLFMCEDFRKPLDEAYRILKPGGMVMIIEWIDSFNHLGPHPDYILSKSKIISYLEEINMHKREEWISGDYHYAIIYYKS